MSGKDLRAKHGAQRARRRTPYLMAGFSRTTRGVGITGVVGKFGSCGTSARLLHDRDFLTGEIVQPINDLVNPPVGERDLQFQGDETGFGSLEAQAEFLLVALLDPHARDHDVHEHADLPAFSSQKIDQGIADEARLFPHADQRARRSQKGETPFPA
jgi:hypothetical protein